MDTAHFPPQASTSTAQTLLEDGVKQKALELLTFGDQPELLRGVPLGVVLWNGAKLFGSSKGTHTTFSLSKSVDSIRTFISHNWSVSRWKKCVALSMYYNFQFAFAATVIANILMGALCYAKLVPAADEHSTVGVMPIGLLVRPTAVLLFSFFLFAGRDFFTAFNVKGPPVFLDKVCIHQTNAHVQKKGISKLGAYIHHSDSMLVLFTTVYFHKLWTVFELAAYLLQHGVHNLEVVIVELSVKYYFAMLAYGIGPIVTVVCDFYRAPHTPAFITIPVVAFATSVVLRNWHFERSTIEEHLRSFSCKNAACAVEADRPYILANIAAMMKAFERCDPDLCTDETLDAFDELVRRELPKAFDIALGKSSFDFSQIILLAYTSTICMGLDHLSVLSSANETQLRFLLTSAAMAFSWSLAVYPLMWYFQERLLRENLHLRGWKNILYLVGVQCLLWIPGGLFQVAGRRCRDMSLDADGNEFGAFFFAASVTFGSITASLTRPLFGARTYSRRGEKLSGFQAAFGKVGTTSADLMHSDPDLELFMI